MSQTPDRTKINPLTLLPYDVVDGGIQSRNYEEGKQGWRIGDLGEVEISPAMIKDATITTEISDPLRAHAAWEGMGLGIEIATLAPGVSVEPGDVVTANHLVTNHRLPDHLIGPTPAADERRFLAVTQRKVDDIEQQIEALLNECKQYPGIDQRHLSIFRTHCEIGLAFAAKALMYVEIVDDGK
jgi:hypothetical protein